MLPGLDETEKAPFAFVGDLAETAHLTHFAYIMGLAAGQEVAMSAATNREERLQIMLEADELRAVDDFRYKYRLPSRAAAVRELLKRGLANLPSGEVADGSRSQDFGVLGLANGSRFKAADGSESKE